MKFDTRTIVAVAGAALVLGLAGTTRADDTCSNHTLRGDYAFTIDGTILNGPAPVLLRGVAMTHFDGDGNLTQVDFATRNGIPMGPDWRPAGGTYQVNEDCTGSAEIVPVVGPSIPLRLVVFDGGRQVATVVIGNATGSLGRRVR